MIDKIMLSPGPTLFVNTSHSSTLRAKSPTRPRLPFSQELCHVWFACHNIYRIVKLNQRAEMLCHPPRFSVHGYSVNSTIVVQFATRYPNCTNFVYGLTAGNQEKKSTILFLRTHQTDWHSNQRVSTFEGEFSPLH